MSVQEDYQKELRDRKKRQQQLDAIVRAATDSVAASVSDERPPLRSHFFYGASAVHPRHLVTWYLFQTDSDYAGAKASGLTTRIETRTRQQLLERGYPSEWVSAVMVSFTTDETVQRETGGNHWEYFK